MTDFKPMPSVRYDGSRSRHLWRRVWLGTWIAGAAFLLCWWPATLAYYVVVSGGPRFPGDGPPAWVDAVRSFILWQPLAGLVMVGFGLPAWLRLRRSVAVRDEH